MMGRRERDQGKLFYEFKLDEMVPADHLLLPGPGAARQRSPP